MNSRDTNNHRPALVVMLTHNDFTVMDAAIISYRLTEDDHHFHKEDNGKYYRISKIYRETIDRESGKVVSRELNWNNHSEVMFDYNLIPKEQIR